MKEFSSLAGFKKLCKKGEILNTIYHKHWVKGVGYVEKIIPPREISIVQSNAIALKTKHDSGKENDSWFHFPKASDVEVKDDQKLLVYEKNSEGEKELILTYWFE